MEATTERYEDEDGHVRIDPPAGWSEGQMIALEEQIAERCVDILVDAGVLSVPRLTSRTGEGAWR